MNVGNGSEQQCIAADLSDNERKFWLQLRQGLMYINDSIERYVDIRPRTSEIRKALVAAQQGNSKLLDELLHPR